MSRLDSAIRRLTAQRDCLDGAARLIGDVPGPVLELGLGNGRTYDHLRTLFPEREIFVFDRRVAAHPDCVPDAAHMILGDIAETLPGALTRLGKPAALAHADLGTGDKVESQRRADALAPVLAPLLAPGAVVVSDYRLTSAPWAALPLPNGVEPGRYYMYRAT